MHSRLRELLAKCTPSIVTLGLMNAWKNFHNHDRMLYSSIFFSWGKLDIVAFLVEGKHCDLEAKDKDGDTPLHVAIW